MDFTPLKNFLDDMARHHTPGNAIAVYLKGNLVYQYCSGYSDYENNVPLQADELYNIYSCSKVTTVTAALQLVEQGKCKLDDPLYDYIPEYRDMQILQADGNLVKAKNTITLRHLFTMSAGLTYQQTTAGFQKVRELTGGRMNTLDVVRAIAADPIVFEPGTHWGYSLCHDVLAGVVEVISGLKFRDYVKKAIFEPLDMQETCYHHTLATLARTAQQYRFVADDNQTTDIIALQKSGNAKHGVYQRIAKENPFVYGEEYDSGGAGIITSVNDYAKLTAALGNQGIGITEERILKPETIALMKTNVLNETMLQDLHTWPQLAGCGYGLGVRTHMDPVASGLCCNIGEFGWGGAAGATVIADTTIGLGVFYAQHILNPREEYYQPRLRDTVYRCL